jgi:hypothetical protein
MTFAFPIGSLSFVARQAQEVWCEVVTALSQSWADPDRGCNHAWDPGPEIASHGR